MVCLIIVGCGSGSNNIVGTWVNDNDKITFSKDGSFSAYYYFMDGEWEEFEEGKVSIIQELAGSEKYFYEIDNGVLTLTNCVKGEDGE